MQEIVEVLRQSGVLVSAWQAIVWTSAAYLIVLGVLMVTWRALANRFLDGFVRSRTVNAIEAALRLIAGLAFIGVSPESKMPDVFFGFGAILAVTAIPMAFLYHAHRRIAAAAIPFAKRVLPQLGLCAVAAGIAIGWAII